jgi:hypothetical protein
MNLDELKTASASWLRIAIAAMIAQFIVLGSDIWTIDGEGLKSIGAAGVAALAVTIYNWLNPRDDRFGRVADSGSGS